MWLFYCYMVFITVSGTLASFGFHGLPSSSPGACRINNRHHWSSYLIIVVAVPVFAFSGINRYLPGVGYHWLLLIFSFYYMWLFGRIKEHSLIPVRLKIFQALSLLSLLISWLVLSVNIENNKVFAIVLSLSFAATFFIAFIPRLKKVRYRAGNLFACMQCALALYYIIEKRWDNLTTSIPTSENEGGVFADTTGILAMCSLLAFFLIGLLYKYFKTRNND